MDGDGLAKVAPANVLHEQSVGRIRPLAHLAAWLFLVSLGVGAIAWSVTIASALRENSSLQQVANHIIAGDEFKTNDLKVLLNKYASAARAQFCNPPLMQSVSIIRLNLLDQMFANGDKIGVSDMDDLDTSIRRSLACMPSDAFLWLALYWVENMQDGFQPKNIGYLRLSYELGPNEGWIALKRNYMAFAIFQQLPSDLQRIALDEFARLLNSGFVDETAAILAGPAWPEREDVLVRLTQVSQQYRDAFAKVLYKEDYDVFVPGVKRPDPRPWD